MKHLLGFGLLVSAILSCSTSPAEPEATPDGSVAADARGFEIRVSLVEASSAAAAPWIGAGDSSSKVVAADAADAMLATLSKAGQVTARPMIFVRPGSTAHISNSSKVEYVQDFTSDAQPMKATIEEGCWISATPSQGAGERTEVACSFESASLVRPIREAQLTLPGSTQERSVQLPVVARRTCTSTVALSSDEVALLRMDATTPPEGGIVRFALLRVRPAN
jgi:hypothetical protein